MSDMIYLKIGGTVFSGDLAPDAVTPKTELINNSERSLDGTMNIDIIARKVSLEVSWSVLSAGDMTTVNKIAESAGTYEVIYISPETSAQKTIIAYVEDFSYTPFFVGSHLQWKDVTLKLTEI